MEKNTATRPKREPRADLSLDEREYIPDIDPDYLPNEELLLHIQLDLAEHKPVCLTGHAGTSKTSIFEYIAAACRQPFVRLNCNGQSSISDFVGYNGAEDGTVSWIDGVFTWAVRRGIWVCLDEVDFSEPAVLSILNSVTEKNGKLVLKEKGRELIKPHPNFRVMATANTVGKMEEFRHIYPGANIMNAAFTDRFRIYHTDYLPEELETQVLIKRVPDCPEEAAVSLVNFAGEIRRGFINQTIDKPFSIRGLIDFAEMLVRLRKIHLAAFKKSGKKVPEMEEVIADVITLVIEPKYTTKDLETIKNIASMLNLI